MELPRDEQKVKEELERDKLRKKLKDRIGEKKIGRSNKIKKEQVLDESIRSVGMDPAQFKESMELLKKMPQKERDRILNEGMQKASNIK